jgi:hypothetical protein
MDILNFISWVRGSRVVTSVDPAKTLIPVGLKDGRRDDEYLAGAITVADLASQIAPQPTYKVYTALLTQTGTDAPVATVLENSFGGEVVWTRDAVGSYVATCAIQNLFSEQNFYVSGLSNGNSEAIFIPITNFSTIIGYYSIYPNSSNRFILEFFDSTFNTVEFSDLFTSPEFVFYLPEIRVYN